MGQRVSCYRSVAGLIASPDLPLGLPLHRGAPAFNVAVVGKSASSCSSDMSAVGRAQGRFELADVAMCDIDFDRRVLVIQGEARVHQDRVAHFLTDHVLPRLAGLDGVCFHASAIVVDDQSFIFIGPSGAGKSTLAAHMAVQGAQLLGDDCAHLKEGMVYPSFRDSRLWPEAATSIGARHVRSPDATGKVTLGSSDGVRRCDRPHPLQEILLVDIERRDVALTEALPVILGQQFRFTSPPPVRALDEALDLIRRYGPVRTISRNARLSELAA